MLGEPENQFSLTRAAPSTCGHAKSKSSISIRNHSNQYPFVRRLVALCVVLLSAVATSGLAATITVTNTADNGAGTLRAALASATNGDTINFSITGAITLTSGELLVNKSVTILGPGPASLAVNGNFPNTTNRVFYITNAVTAAIFNLTITNGHAGGIWNDHSKLTVSNCTFSGNAAGNGAGIYNDGSSSNRSATLSVIASSFSGNSASSTGGGIYNAGRLNGSATLSVSASTFSSNSATLDGGGMYNDGAFSGSATLTVSNCTLNGNYANRYGGGIYNYQATLEIGDTILNAGASGANIANDSGTVTTHGYNLSGDNGGGFLTNATDQINTDPKLGPLANNGGPTFTHALMTGSPAIDKGKRDAIPSLALTTDQRGAPRPDEFSSITNASGGDGSDIGAFEVQAAAVASTPILLTMPQKPGNGSFQFSFTNTPGASFTVLNTTNVALPLSNWTALGAPTEISSGHFQFTDPQATNHAQGYYRVRSP